MPNKHFYSSSESFINYTPTGIRGRSVRTYGQFGSTKKSVVVVVDVGNVEEGMEEVGLTEGLTEGFSVRFGSEVG